MKSILAALLLCFALSGCGGGSSTSTPTQPTGPTPSVTMSITPATVNAGQPATLTWSSANVTACTAGGTWQDPALTSGSTTLVNVAPNTYTYNLSCTGAYGTATNSANLTVTSTPSQVTIPLPGPPAACTSNCYYVDANSGSDSNNGLTPATAFQTLQKAAGVATPGATVTVMSGTYTSNTVDVLNITTSGTSSAWIRFIAGAGQHPVIQLAANTWAWNGILITANYIVIDGFEIIGQNQSLTTAQVGQSDPNNGLFNEACININGDTGPITHDVIVRNNVVHDCTGGGIGTGVADSITIAYNTIYNNAWWTYYDGSGISLWISTDAPGATVTNGYKNFIVGNVLYNNQNYIASTSITPPGITDGNGIIIDSNRHIGASAEPNDIQGAPYTGRTYIANNIVYGNGGRGIHAVSSAHVDIVNNTTYNNMLTNSQYIESGEVDGQGSYDVNAVNNIGMNLNGKGADENDSGVVYWFNLWSGTNVPVVGTDGLVADPQFTDTAKADFIPKASSPALGSGTATLAPTIDFAGFSRPAATIDRGAYQVTH